jgi:hypothetical protein
MSTEARWGPGARYGTQEVAAWPPTDSSTCGDFGVRAFWEGDSDSFVLRLTHQSALIAEARYDHRSTFPRTDAQRWACGRQILTPAWQRLLDAALKEGA